MKRKTKIILILMLVIAIAVTAGIYFNRQSDIYADSPVVQEEPLKQETEKNTSFSVSDRRNSIENAESDKIDTESETPEESKENPVKTEDRRTGDKDQPSSRDSEEKKGHYEERQVLVRDAYDEKVLVKKGECTQILVKDAYDTEEIVYLDGAYYGADKEEFEVCNDCGARFRGGISEHLANSETCGAWHNEWIEVGEPYWHNVEYRTVHHDAVYETRCEPDEYETVHHEAIYRTEMVWVDD